MLGVCDIVPVFCREPEHGMTPSTNVMVDYNARVTCNLAGVRVRVFLARDGLARRPLDTGVRRGPSRYLVTGGWCSFPDLWG